MAPFSYTGLLFIIGAAVVTLAFYINVRRVERIQQQRAEAAGRHELLNMVRTLLARLQKDYGGDTKRKSFLVEPVVRLEYQGLGMTLKGTGRSVLDGVTGVYQPGQLHAVMGPSGSGVSSTSRLPRSPNNGGVRPQQVGLYPEHLG